MRVPPACVLVACVGLAAGACDKQRAPSAPAPLPAARQPIRIVSGIDGSPVALAKVSVDGDDSNASGPDGQVFPDAYSGASTGAAIDVEARGFLPRQTRIPNSRIVTLWPVADDAEAEAVHEMVYRQGQPEDQVLQPVPGWPFKVFLVTSSADAHKAWTTAASVFGQAIGRSYEITSKYEYDPNEISVAIGGTGRCHPIVAWGFCRDGRFGAYYVLPERGADAATIQRVLASWFLGPNPLPGLMNLRAPAEELSALEIQTIRMILQRSLPTRWPDNDR